MPKRYKETGYKRTITEEIKRQVDDWFDKKCIPPLIAGHKFMTKGMRVSDACRVKIDNIDFMSKQIRIIQLKTKYPLIVYLDENILQWLKAYILIFKREIDDHLGYICFSPYYKPENPESAHIQETSFRWVWKQFRDAMHYNIPYYTCIDGKKLYDLTPHVLKRRAVTTAYAVSKDIRVAQKVGGHKRIETTFKYLNEPAECTVREASSYI